MIQMVGPYAELTLAISDKADREREAVAEAWAAGGGVVVRIGRFWDPPALDTTRVRLYGADTFCQVLAQKWELELISPADDLLAGLEHRWLGRRVELRELGDVRGGPFPCFVKSAAPKLFRAAVYASPEELMAECEGLEPNTPILVSEVVVFRAEARAFVLDGEVKTVSIYEGAGDAGEATAFSASAAREIALPRTVVLDVGLIPGFGWALVEANAAWGAGLNGCDATEAAACIARATGSKGAST